MDVVKTMLYRGTVCSYSCCCCFRPCGCLVSIVMVRVRVADSYVGIRRVLPVVMVTVLSCFGSRVNLGIRSMVILGVVSCSTSALYGLCILSLLLLSWPCFCCCGCYCVELLFVLFMLLPFVGTCFG